MSTKLVSHPLVPAVGDSLASRGSEQNDVAGPHRAPQRACSHMYDDGGDDDDGDDDTRNR